MAKQGMNTEQIIALRTKLKALGAKIRIIGDNNMMFDDSTSDSIVVWHDTDEYIVCIRINNERDQALRPFEVSYMGYDNIQYITTDIDYAQMLKLIPQEVSEENQAKVINAVHDMGQGISYTNATGDGATYPRVKPEIR